MRPVIWKLLLKTPWIVATLMTSSWVHSLPDRTPLHGSFSARRFFSMNTTAIGRPRWSRVVSSISAAPRASSFTNTAGWPSLNPELASTSCSPEAMTSRLSSTGPPSRR